MTDSTTDLRGGGANTEASVGIVWLTRCVAVFSLLGAFTVGAAWGQAPSGVPATSADAALVGPMGLVPRVGDRSVILHWDPRVEASPAGYHVYRASSATGPFEPHRIILPTHHFVDVAVDNGATYRYRVRAVDPAGRESLDSATIRATPTGSRTRPSSTSSSTPPSTISGTRPTPRTA